MLPLAHAQIDYGPGASPVLPNTGLPAMTQVNSGKTVLMGPRSGWQDTFGRLPPQGSACYLDIEDLFLLPKTDQLASDAPLQAQCLREYVSQCQCYRTAFQQTVDNARREPNVGKARPVAWYGAGATYGWDSSSFGEYAPFTAQMLWLKEAGVLDAIDALCWSFYGWPINTGNLGVSLGDWHRLTFAMTGKAHELRVPVWLILEPRVPETGPALDIGFWKEMCVTTRGLRDRGHIQTAILRDVPGAALKWDGALAEHYRTFLAMLGE